MTAKLLQKQKPSAKKATPKKATLKKKVVSHKNPRTGKTVTVDTKKAKIVSSKSVAPKKTTPKKKVDLNKRSVPNTVETKINSVFKAEIADAKTLIAKQTNYHLEQVLVATGKILPEDRAYCKELGNRILRKKFPTLNF